MSELASPFQWHHTVNRNKIRLLDQWITGREVLDIGCGAGFYSGYLRTKGYEVTAIDRENRCSGDCSFRFVAGDVPPLPFPDKSFDVTLLFDVLEHVEEDSLLLREIKRVTRCCLIISVPATDSGVLAEYGVCLSHNLDKSHLRTYDEKGLVENLERHGFRVSHIEAQRPVRLPYVIFPYFSKGVAGRCARFVTKAWIKLLVSSGLLQITLPADWLAVASVSEPVALDVPS